MAGERIGIIEDDRLLNQALKIAVEKEGFEAVQAYSIREGRGIFSRGCALFLVDVNLPDGDGIRLCRELRQEEEVPVIFLTARDEEEDMLEAFQAGGDDYVVKPFPMKVLLERIRAVLRRTGEDKEAILCRGLKIQPKSRRVTCRGEEVSLTQKEYQLLELLARHKGQVLSKEQILERIWDLDGLFVGENTVSVTVNRLRKKLGDWGERHIKNIFGQGYRLGEE